MNNRYPRVIQELQIGVGPHTSCCTFQKSSNPSALVISL